MQSRGCSHSSGTARQPLNLTPALLSGGAALVTWRAALRLVRIPQLAAIAGVLVWVAPDAFLANSTREGGFRGVTMLCGLVCILCALRLLDGSRRFVDVMALGLFAGLGWWSSPEVAYFLVPAGLLTLGVLFGGGPALRWWITRLISRWCRLRRRRTALALGQRELGISIAESFELSCRFAQQHGLLGPNERFLPVRAPVRVEHPPTADRQLSFRRLWFGPSTCSGCLGNNLCLRHVGSRDSARGVPRRSMARCSRSESWPFRCSMPRSPARGTGAMDSTSSF